MSDLPKPFTSPQVDLRGMPYMPLDVHRLFESDFYALASGEEFKAALTLWGRSFYQIPAGSLPADERLLAHFSGAKCWADVKDMALHGWIKCADGRLYHATVAEKVAEAWEARLLRRARTQAARAAKLKPARAFMAEHEDVTMTEHVTAPVADDVTGRESARVTNDVAMPVAMCVAKTVTEDVAVFVTASKGTEKNRTERNREEEKAKTQTAAMHQPDEGRVDEVSGFEAFWQIYPRRVGKGQARRAFALALGKVGLSSLLAALRAYEFDPRERFQPHPATWLNGERWLDEASTHDPVLRAAGVGMENENNVEAMLGLLQ